MLAERLTRALSNLPIRRKFLLVPAILTVMLLVAGAYVLNSQQQASGILAQVHDRDVPKMRELSQRFSAFSTNHVRFINLLASTLKQPTSEGDIYAQGRKNIIATNEIIEQLETLAVTFSLQGTQHETHRKLLEKLIDYRDQMGSAILMSSVELKLIAQVALRANEAYDQANTLFLQFVDAVQEDAQDSISLLHDNLVAQTQNIYTILALLFVAVLALSLYLSSVFAADLKRAIKQLARLSGGQTDVDVEHHDRADEFGEVNRAITVFRDTTIERNKIEGDLKNEIKERIRIEQSLRISEERFRTLYEDNPLILFTVNEQGQILSINRRGAMQIGFDANELIGTSVLQLVMQEDRDDALSMIQQCAQSPGTRHQRTLRKSHKDGNVIWLRETGQTIRNGDSPVMLLACEDITEARVLSEKLSYQATHDKLTGLVNRWEFERRLARTLATSSENKSAHVLCYVDLDQFKIINDTYGHAAGDQMLRQLSNVLQGSIRNRDTLARLGGDEFGILFEHCVLSNGWRAAGALLQEIQTFRFPWEDREFRIGASIGLVEINENSPSADQILSDADTACYAAKEQGRNRIHVYMADDARMTARRGEMRWATRIPQALDNNQFELYYQRILSASTADVYDYYFEILIRLRDEEGRLVSPGEFLPAAERYNLSAKLDQWVVDAAIDELQRINPRGNLNLCCAINLSGLSLGNDEFLAFISDKLDSSGIAPHSICFEVTETAAVLNLAQAKEFITTLKRKGVLFSLDDFGTGLSSFAYLKELPVDTLKIDGVFVKDINTDPIQFAMVKSINEIGHVMGIKTVAEFVETAEIAETLKAIGVNYLQGYHIARPLPLADFLAIEQSA